MYLTIIRPDLSYAVQQHSQFLDKSTVFHWRAAHRVLRYIKVAPGQGLFFKSYNQTNLAAYCDSEWAGCEVTRRSVIGFCVFLGSALVSWRSKKQTTASKSSVEAEYGASYMVVVVSALQWMLYLLGDLHTFQEQAASLFCECSLYCRESCFP